MSSQKIVLISFGYLEKRLLEQVIEDIESQFSFPVLIHEGHLDLSEYYDPARRQYDGNRLLKVVEQQTEKQSIKAIGIFNVDLFIPILTYIFGQALLGGNAGIASMYRLGNERYGMDSDELILLERLKKEIIHELGHMFGLIHCRHQTCVMRSSTYVEDIDQKSQQFCPQCMEKSRLHTF